MTLPIISAKLLIDGADLLIGLACGDYVRWGGVIRRAKGTPGAGQIVAMLREFPPLDQAFSTLSSLTHRLSITSGLNRVEKNTSALLEGQQVTHTMISVGFSNTEAALGKVINLSGVGAAASVLNLGMSAAGFYMMNRKLNLVQQSLNTVQQLTSASLLTLDDVDARTRMMQDTLIELRFIALEHADQLESLLEAVHDVKSALFARQMAQLQLANEEISRLGDVDDQPTLQRQHERVYQARLELSNELAARNLSTRDDPRRFMDTLALMRAWAMASALDVQLLRRMNQPDRAATLAEQLATQARSWVSAWTAQLLPAQEFGGVARFDHSGFDGLIAEDTRMRLGVAQHGELRSVSEDMLGSTEHIMQLQRARHDLGWFQRQAALARVVDMLEETCERVESLHAEATLCAAEALTFDLWERAEPTTDARFDAALQEHLAYA